jgi:hypothetical protein
MSWQLTDHRYLSEAIAFYPVTVAFNCQTTALYSTIVLYKITPTQYPESGKFASNATAA